MAVTLDTKMSMAANDVAEAQEKLHQERDRVRFCLRFKRADDSPRQAVVGFGGRLLRPEHFSSRAGIRQVAGGMIAFPGIAALAFWPRIELLGVHILQGGA